MSTTSAPSLFLRASGRTPPHGKARAGVFVPMLRHLAELSTLDVRRFLHACAGKFDTIADLICIDLRGTRAVYAMAACGSVVLLAKGCAA